MLTADALGGPAWAQKNGGEPKPAAARIIEASYILTFVPPQLA